jgi:Transcription factor WhiB
MRVMISEASCARSGEDPDAWFPRSRDVSEARREAAGAIAVCDICLARASCLELSLRDWDIGQYGVWGGLVPAERETLRRKRRVRPATAAAGHT